MLLSPENAISIQNAIGADIIMQLDDVVHTLTTGKRVEEAMWRTLRWLDRCVGVHMYPNKQALFGIVQGGLQPNLRQMCVEGIISDNARTNFCIRNGKAKPSWLCYWWIKWRREKGCILEDG